MKYVCWLKMVSQSHGLSHIIPSKSGSLSPFEMNPSTIIFHLYHVISCYIMLCHVKSCYIMLYHVISLYLTVKFHTSSTAQGGGGSFKNRKPIGEIGCCESGMAERSR